MKLAKLNNNPEIFYSIQGEGRNIGSRCVFIRLSLCNLSCRWCDTDYTWNFLNTPFEHNSKLKHDKTEVQMDIDVIDCASRALFYPSKNFVITGGEPLVQQKQVTDLIQILKDLRGNAFVEIETNGTLIPEDKLDELVDQYNVSIKLSNSGVPLEQRIRSAAIHFFAHNQKSYFKFVVEHASDIHEINDLVEYYKINPEKVYLMPQGNSREELNEKSQWIIDQCKKNKYNFSDRLHVRIYGNERGV